MKKISTGILILLVILVAMPTHAQSPREQLNQLVAQLQASPGDTALRERIIKLAQEIKPPPALPEEAERRMARGSAAFKAAKSENDYKDAVREFEQAYNAAPWSGDIYYNLGLAQDKAGDYASAIRSLKLAMLAVPGSRETRTLLYEVEYRQEKANSPEALAARKREKDEGMLSAIEGAVFRWTHPDSRQTHTVEVRGRIASYKRVFDGGIVTASCPLSVVEKNATCEAFFDQTFGVSPWRIFIDVATHGRSVWTAWIEPSGKKLQPVILNRAN
ncbi:MAG: tetratricopeptide repeat protein [Burkholderiales bacterium]|jgi:hypothetical protein|nr:tetratricopeptide repeat protein [Burkholderiales bacterium]